LFFFFFFVYESILESKLFFDQSTSFRFACIDQNERAAEMATTAAAVFTRAWAPLSTRLSSIALVKSVGEEA